MNEALRGAIIGGTAAIGGAGQFVQRAYADIQESPCEQALKKIHAAIARLNEAHSTLNNRISKVVPQVVGEGCTEKASALEHGTSSLITELFSIARQLDQQAQGVEYLNNRIEL